MSGFKKRRGNRRGFLLIELLASVLLLSTALVALSRSFSKSAAISGYTASLLQAEMRLEEKMAEFEADATLSPGTPSGSFGEPGGFDWAATVVKRPEPTLYDVTLTVSWQEGSQPRSVTVRTFVEKSPETP